ncbi:hypothetical protein EY161_00060 [Shigella sonnei]|nr:hypothetical protein [Salmonella enterica]ECD5912374.1 hypothetical protein [Salmonella enterica subsp. enterica]EDR4731574.1 hypothetical protein [Salmonella enterica subsp. enterica serovar 4,[5],12:b:-]EFX2900449.1 hypothetical protein [Shigella sonnei]HAN2065355.1 PilI type IV pilus biogenesis protein [Escherichia coli]HDO2954935.1 PilI type IV pilus biogenesis protein [Salmonella enterica subsp. enterica serovar Typhimurium]
MPRQHPGRLQVLVVDTRCERRLFYPGTLTSLARFYRLPGNPGNPTCNPEPLFRSFFYAKKTPDAPSAVTHYRLRRFRLSAGV